VIVPQDALVAKALKTWRASHLKPDGTRPVLTHLLPLPDGRRAWTNGFLLEVTDAPHPRLGLSLEPPVYDRLADLTANLVRLIDGAPTTNPMRVVRVHIYPEDRTAHRSLVMAGKGVKWLLSADFAAYFHTRYPDATWYGGRSTMGPIRVVNGETTVGVVMPIYNPGVV
jgi:hypothetical protein